MTRNHPQMFWLQRATSTAVFGLLSAWLCAAPVAAASFGDLAAPPALPGAAFTQGTYATPPAPACPPACYGTQMPMQQTPAMSARENFLPSGAEGVPPSDPRLVMPFVPTYQLNPRAYLPLAPGSDLPAPQLQLWSFGQINNGTDPFNPWGLSTPYLYVPWSTPLTGWTNAQSWNWWREKSGALPRNW